MTRKVKPIGKLVDEVATLLQKAVRLKDFNHNGGYCICVTCGKTGHWKEFDGGHWISRTYSATKLEETNVHPQCKGCNRFGHKVHDDYTLYMIETYGKDYVDGLNARKREIKKWDRSELIEMKMYYKELIKELE